jgi:hypothetical protein
MAFVVLGGAVACGSDSVGPSNQPPAALSAVSDLNRSVAVGAVVPSGIVVTVSDADGRPVQNASVAFAVTAGNGSVDPRLAVTNSKGQASGNWTIGTVIGANEVTASVTGVATQIKFEATGTAGPVASIVFTPLNARLGASVDSLRVTAQSLDAFGNPTTPVPTLVVRDPTMVSIDGGGLIRAISRGSHTYVVATAGTKTDSILVTVLAVGQSPCADAAVPLDLAVGQVVTDQSGAGFCVHASAAGAEYAVVPYFNTMVPNATVPIEVRAQGIVPLPVSLGNVVPALHSAAPEPTLVPNYAFEDAMRDRERAEMAKRGAAIRAADRTLLPGAARRTIVVPALGDLLQLNTNAVAYCDSAIYRTGRVVAITNKAIVVADTSNPAGGFTDAEYRSIGVTFDTLINPTDSAAFGAVTDIDNNGHVILFFSHAVNDLTQTGATSVVLGFFYDRDLLPKVGASGPCDASNVAEMFYLVVPDPASGIANFRSKSTVVSYTDGTVAHEYQHLINASRRLYVNHANGVSEERWLDEGLAHTAEELNFFAATGLKPRSNPTYSASDPKFVAAFNTFEKNNFLRYSSYLLNTETQSPVSFGPAIDGLQTRGAIWSFLRFVADHLPAGQEDAFWYKLVNSTTSGVANLTNALGSAPNSLLRDWAISVFMDDNASGVDARFQQPSWNFRTALPASSSLPFPLITRTLTDNVAKPVTLVENGVSFLRFSVINGQEALITVTSGGQLLPSTVQLAVVRVR